MNDNAPHNAARLDDLEMRIAHQDAMMAELNEVITAQARQIDALQRQVARLRDEFQNTAAPRGDPDPPPPHY